MKVSVIVPVYNTEKYLEKCLDSLVNQNFKDYEVIVVNDESPDNSEKIIQEYEKKYSFLHSYKKKNGGLSDARNYGLKYAKGDYILFVDSDDYVDINMLKIMYNKAKEDDSDAVVCNFIYKYDDNEVIGTSNLDYTEDLKKKLIIGPPMVWTKLYRKEVLKNVSFTKGIYYEDLDFLPKVFKYINKISYVDDSLYYYYQREGSIMKENKFNPRFLDIFEVLSSCKKELYNDYPMEVEYLYITHLLRTASLRFSSLNEGRELINKIVDIFKEYFPNWKNNIYLKKSSFKMKIICKLAYYKRINMLKLMKKIFRK